MAGHVENDATEPPCVSVMLGKRRPGCQFRVAVGRNQKRPPAGSGRRLPSTPLSDSAYPLDVCAR